MKSVERGKWKLVRRISTARNRYPGVMKISVSPLKGSIAPSSVLALSNNRNEVVPTATMRPPATRAPLSAWAVTAEILPHSECILCPEVSSVLTGRNVPAPTCKVTRCMATPRWFNAASSAGVKCSPAVGAATAPSLAANIV